MTEPYLPRPGPRTRDWARRNRFDPWRVARLARLSDQPALFLDGLVARPPQYIRVNPLRAEVSEAKKRLEARGFRLAGTDLDPNIWRVQQAPVSPGATHEHLLGMTTPQDLASAAAPIALGARPGDVVADLAAAPGVKTLHLAADLAAENVVAGARPRSRTEGRDAARVGDVVHGGDAPKAAGGDEGATEGSVEAATRGSAQDGIVVAVEPDPDRMRALRFNLERCGVTNAVLRLEGAQDTPGEEWADRVLLDAPCTGEGTLPKDRTRGRGRPEEITRLAALQSELLSAADRILRPGGVLVYATCTFAPEENEMRLEPLLERGYAMEDLPFSTCGGHPLAPGVTEWGDQRLHPDLEKARRFLPGIHPTLGFFVARLRKEGP